MPPFIFLKTIRQILAGTRTPLGRTNRTLRLVQLEDRRMLNGAIAVTGITLTGAETLTIAKGENVDTVDLTLTDGTWTDIDDGLTGLYDLDDTGRILTVDASVLHDGGFAVGAGNTLHIQGDNQNSQHLSIDLTGVTALDTFIPSNGIDFTAGEKPGGGGGGGENDSLSVTGFNPSTVDTLTVSHTGMESGEIDLGGLGTITYSEIEPLALGGTAANLIINLPAGDDNTVQLSDNGVAGDGISRISGAFELTTFANPTVSLTINDGTGIKAISVRGLDGLFDANLSILEDDAVDDNTVTFEVNSTDVDSGTLHIEAGPIALDASIITTGNVELFSTDSITDGNGGAVNIASATATLSAVNGIGSGDALETSITQLVATNTTAGTIEIAEVAAGVDIALGAVSNGTRNVSISAAAGAITDGNGVLLNITAGTATLSATAGIGSGDALETSITQLEATNTTAGTIEIAEDAAGIDIALGAVSNGTRNVSISAAAGAITDGNGALVNITAGTATLSATAGIGSGDAIETSITQLVATNTTAGTIEIAEVAAGVDIALGAVSNGTRNVSISAAAGAITDGNGVLLNITAGTATLSATAGIGSGDALETSITQLEATNTTAGTIEIAEDAAGVDIALGAVSNGTRNVSISAAAGAITDGNGALLNITAGTATLSATAGIGSGDALETSITQLVATNTTAGTIEIAEVAAGVDIALGAVSNGTRNVSISAAAGAITDGNGVLLNITAGTATLSATAGIGSGDALETSITQLEATNTTAGTIEIAEDAAGIDIALGAVSNGTRNVSISAAAGAITDGNGALVNITAGTATLSATAGIGSGDAIETSITQLVATNTTAGTIEIAEVAAGVDIALGAVSNGTRNVSISAAAGAITDGNGALVNITAGTATLSATAGIGSGDAIETSITQLVATNTTAGTIEIAEVAAGVDIALGAVSNGTRAVSISAAAGAITDGNGVLLNITAGTATLSATAGIGSGDALETSITQLEATNTTAGTIEITEVAGGVDIALGAVSNPGRDVVIQSVAGSITDGNAAAVNVSAQNLTMNALTNVGNGPADVFKGVFDEIEVFLSGTLIVSAGNIAAVSGTITPATTITATTGYLSSEGDLNVTGMTFNVTNLALVADSDNNTFGTLTLVGAVAAAGDLRIQGADVAPAGAITLSANRILFRSGAAETVNVTTGTLDATAADLTVNSAAAALDLLDLDCDNVALQSTANAGNVSLTAVGSVTVSDDVIAGNDLITNSTGGITVIANGATSNIIVNDVILADNGNIVIRADNDVRFGMNFSPADVPPILNAGTVPATDDLPVVTTVNGIVTIVADANGDANGVGGAVTMANGSRVVAGRDTAINYVPGINGDASPSSIVLGAIAKAVGQAEVNVTSDGDVTLGSLQSANNAANAIRITSISRGVIDGGDADIDLFANFLGAVTTITARTGIGSSGPLDTSIDSLIATNAVSGNIEIHEIAGLSIEGTGVRTLGGNGLISIDVDSGNLSVNSVVTADGSGNVTLNADAGTITLASAVSSTTGNVLISGDVVNQNSNILTGGAGTIGVTADNGSITMTDGTTSTTTSGTIDYSATANVALSLLTSGIGGGSINVTADSDSNGTGAITDNTAAENANLVTSTTATLRAAQGIGSAGVADIDTTIGTLIASNTASGTIVIEELVAGGDIGLGAVNNGNRDVTITAAGGAITDGNAGVLNVTAGVFTLNATNGIGSGNAIEISVNSLNATNTTTGSIEIVESNGLSIEGTGVRTLGGNGLISIDVDSGNLSVNSVVTADGSGNVTLNADAGTITLASAVSSTTGNVLISGDVVNQNSNILTGGAGTIGVTADNGSITMTDGTTSTTTSGTIDYSATANVALSLLTSGIGGGSINVTADSDSNGTGAITDNTAAENANLVTSTTATLRAAQGIGSAGVADIDTTIGTLIASNTASGTIVIEELVAGGDIGLGAVNNGNRDVTITAAGGAITDGNAGVLNVTAGVFTLNATNGIGSGNAIEISVNSLNATNTTTGSIEIVESNGLSIEGTGVRTLGGNGLISIDVDSGNLSVNSVVTADGSGNVTLNADAGTITLASAVSSTTGNVLISGDVVNQNSNILTGGAGTIGVTADNGSITMADGTTSTTTSGTIDYSATANVYLSLLTSGIGGGSINVTADSDSNGTGAIIDNTAAENANLVTSTTATLRAAQGIGSGNALETGINALIATNTTTGNVQITELNGLGIIGSGVLNQGTGGGIAIDVLAGNLAINGNVTAFDGNVVTTEAISLTTQAGSISIGNNVLISTDDDPAASTPAISHSDAASLDSLMIRAGATGNQLVQIGTGVVLRTDGGVANRFYDRVVPGGPGTSFFSSGGAPIPSTIVRSGTDFIVSFSLTINSIGEENLHLNIDWRDPTGTRVESIDFLTPGVYTVSHLYSFNDFQAFVDAANNTFLADFSVSHNQSIQVLGGTVQQGAGPLIVVPGGVISSTDNPITPPAVPPIPPGLTTVQIVTDNDFSNRDFYFDNGLAEIKIPTLFLPPITPEALPLIPPAPPVAVLIPFVPAQVLVALVEVAETPFSSYSTQSQDYFQLRVFDGATRKVVKGYEHIKDEFGELLLQPARLKQWVTEENLQDQPGLELWLITEKRTGNGAVTVERPVLKFDIANGHPFPAKEPMPEIFEDLHLSPMPLDDNLNSPANGTQEGSVPPLDVPSPSAENQQSGDDRQPAADGQSRFIPSNHKGDELESSAETDMPVSSTVNHSVLVSVAVASVLNRSRTVSIAPSKSRQLLNRILNRQR